MSDIPNRSRAARLEVQDWGLTRYREALARQRELVERRAADDIGDTLVFTEHASVYTIGARKGAAANLLWSVEQTDARGVEVIETNRGGDITCHSPGQIVGYPIISLEKRRDLHAHLWMLEQALVCALGSYGLAASRREGLTGVWLANRKIASIGVAVRKWIAWHGFALNVSNDLSLFDGIVPCGIADAAPTSVERELGEPADAGEIKRLIADEIERSLSGGVARIHKRSRPGMEAG